MGLDKTKKKNWGEGDTFAIKVNVPDSECKNRYIIMIRHDFGPSQYSNAIFFRKLIFIKI